MKEQLFSIQIVQTEAKILHPAVKIQVEACITSAVGQGMPADEVDDVFGATTICTAMDPQTGNVIGFATMSEIQRNDGTHYYYVAATVSREFQGQGVYHQLNDEQLVQVLANQGRSIITTTQNPRVEQGITSSLRRAQANNTLSNFDVSRIHLPQFYGRRLTQYPLETTNTPFELLDIDAGDAFELIYNLSYEEDEICY